MALLEGQVSINGLIVGPGTAYDLVSFNPWRRQVRSDQGGPRAWNHGSWSGAEWRDAIVVDVELHYSSPTTDGWKQLNDDATTAFAPTGDGTTDAQLHFARGGREYVIIGRPRVFEPEMRPGARRSFAVATFVGLDPFIYSADQQTAMLGLPLFTSGLVAPFTVPLTVHGTLSEGVADVTNDGTAETSLLLRIDGPVAQPRIVLQRSDGIVQTLILDIVLQTGQWVDIDTGAHTVLLQGISSRRSQAIGTFPTLPAGTSVLRFFAAEHTDDAQLTATWRHAWW